MSSTFDKLSSTLSREERKALLEKLEQKGVTGDSGEALNIAQPRIIPDFEAAYESLGLLDRIITFLKMVFSGKNRIELMEAWMLKKTARKIHGKCADIIDVNTMVFLPEMQSRLQDMSSKLAVFRTALSPIMNQDKSIFVLYLYSLQLWNEHDSLKRVVHPAKIVEKTGIQSLIELKRKIQEEMERVMRQISDRERSRLYSYARSISHLYTLAQFDFASIIDRFTNGCPVGDVILAMEELEAILNAFTLPPDRTILETIFLFIEEQKTEDHARLEDSVGRQMERSAAALRCIRDFNAAVPLLDILRLFRSNLEYYPNEISGGEDWFQIYRNAWEELSDYNCSLYTRRKRLDNKLLEAAKFLQIQGLPVLPNYQNAACTYRYTIAFIRQIIDRYIIEEGGQTLKDIVSIGRFYKEQNGTTFREVFSGMLKAINEIRIVDRSLAHENGEETEDSEQAEDDGAMVPQPEINQQVLDIILDVMEKLDLLNKLLYGIMYGHPGDVYDGLSNFKDLDIKAHGNFGAKMTSIYNRLSSGLRLISDLYDIENTRKVGEKPLLLKMRQDKEETF